MSIKIKYGTVREKRIVSNIINWYLDNVIVTKTDITIKVEMCKWSKYRCHGSCVDTGPAIDITIATDKKNKSIREFVATVVHEMVHTNQYITGNWSGDGEDEAEKMQYKITDRLWKAGII